MPVVDAILAIAIIIFIVAGVMRGFSGFGAASLIVPVLGFVHGPPIVVAAPNLW